MACCLAVALLIAVVRRGWFRLVPGAAPPEPGFAPQAHRAAPAATAQPTAAAQAAAAAQATAAAQPAAAQSATAAARDRGAARPSAPQRYRGDAAGQLAAVVLTGVAPGVAVYAAVVAAGRATGWLATGPDPLVGWLVRDGLLLGIALAALLLAHRRRAGSGPAALAGVGATVAALSLLDMHVLGLVVLGTESPVADAAFHGAGTLLVLAAVVLERRHAPTPQPG